MLVLTFPIAAEMHVITVLLGLEGFYLAIKFSCKFPPPKNSFVPPFPENLMVVCKIKNSSKKLSNCQKIVGPLLRGDAIFGFVAEW